MSKKIIRGTQDVPLANKGVIEIKNDVITPLMSDELDLFTSEKGDAFVKIDNFLKRINNKVETVNGLKAGTSLNVNTHRILTQDDYDKILNPTLNMLYYCEDTGRVFVNCVEYGNYDDKNAMTYIDWGSAPNSPLYIEKYTKVVFIEKPTENKWSSHINIIFMGDNMSVDIVIKGDGAIFPNLEFYRQSTNNPVNHLFSAIGNKMYHYKNVNYLIDGLALLDPDKIQILHAHYSDNFNLTGPNEISWKGLAIYGGEVKSSGDATGGTTQAMERSEVVVPFNLDVGDSEIAGVGAILNSEISIILEWANVKNTKKVGITDYTYFGCLTAKVTENGDFYIPLLSQYRPKTADIGKRFYVVQTEVGKLPSLPVYGEIEG